MGVREKWIDWFPPKMSPVATGVAMRLLLRHDHFLLGVRVCRLLQAEQELPRQVLGDGGDRRKKVVVRSKEFDGLPPVGFDAAVLVIGSHGCGDHDVEDAIANLLGKLLEIADLARRGRNRGFCAYCYRRDLRRPGWMFCKRSV